MNDAIIIIEAIFKNFNIDVEVLKFLIFDRNF